MRPPAAAAAAAAPAAPGAAISGLRMSMPAGGNPVVPAPGVAAGICPFRRGLQHGMKQRCSFSTKDKQRESLHLHRLMCGTQSSIILLSGVNSNNMSCTVLLHPEMHNSERNCHPRTLCRAAVMSAEGVATCQELHVCQVLELDDLDDLDNLDELYFGRYIASLTINVTATT